MGRARLPYSNKDYASLRRELLARIPQLTDRWTDFNASDLGVVLLECFCAIGDMLAYYLDAQAAECYLPTARQRQHVIDLCALINYRLHAPVAATTTLRFTLPLVQTSDVLIPVGTLAQAQGENSDIPFTTVDELLIPRGQTVGEIGVRQGHRQTEAFTGTGLPGQVLTLPHTDIADGTITVQVGDAAWTVISHFVESDPASPHVQVETDGLDVTHLRFGNGIHGAIPLAGSVLTVQYLTTLGSAGNCAPHRITTLVTPVLVNGAPIPLLVENPVAATGGADRESVGEARQQAPATLRTLWKAVTKADYQALCEGFPGVAKAQVLDANDCLNIRLYTVRICIAPAGGGLPSPLLKQELLTYLDARRVLTVEVFLDDPRYRPVPIMADIYLYPGERQDAVRLRVEEALATFFAFDRQAFGQSLYPSDLIAVLDAVPGVSHVALLQPTGDIRLGPQEIATLGETTLLMREVR
ncbi:MAG: putative baseplate assembly protein [Armatimonadota bacterium]